MESTAASKKPRQEKKSRPRRARRENRSVSGWCFKEKCRSRYDFTSGVPMFANGAITAAFVQAFNEEMHGYDTFEKRAARYRKMQAQMDAAGIDTVWFGVAGDLNDFFAANENYLLTSGEFMNELGVYLYEQNVGTFNSIMSGEITARGQSLDNLLVRREQMHVQSFIGNKFGDSVPLSVQVPVNVAFEFNRSRMPSTMRVGINYVELHNNQSFNFWDTWHRIELGQAMMSQYRHGQ